MIRRFQPDDMASVLGLLEVLRRRTPYRSVKPNFPEAARAITLCSAKRSGLVLVADHAGKITGVLIAAAQELWWQDDHGARIASDLAFFSLRAGDGRKMLQEMIKWAFDVPRVIRIECGISSGEEAERLSKIYLDCGFRLDGTRFVMDHPRYAAALNMVKEAA